LTPFFGAAGVVKSINIEAPHRCALLKNAKDTIANCGK